MTNACATQPNQFVEEFYRKNISTSDQINQFKNYTIEEQYELYKFGNQVVHPPAIYLASVFAQQGAVIVPYIKGVLVTEEDEVSIRDIVLIFSELAQIKLYDFSKDSELMKLLTQKVYNMKGIWKDNALSELSEIQKQR
jgi:hypothetical protein